VIPGQRGALQEDMGDGSLGTSITLQFAGATAQQDYDEVLKLFQRNRREDLVHPLRGTRRSIWRRWREEQRWTQQGNATIVEVSFEDAVLSEPDQLTQGGPSTQAQEVRAQSVAADRAAATQQTRIAGRSPDLANLALRAKIASAITFVGVATSRARAYADAALDSFATDQYDPALLHDLRALPVAVEAAQVAMRATGPAAEINAAVIGLELMLAAATRLDATIRASQPIPIETRVTRAPGQSIYQFVQVHYTRKKTPQQMRDIVRTILRWNRNIRRPDLIPIDTIVIRPAA
jgi:hypothetical protein